jgi:hypothetical protein
LAFRIAPVCGILIAPSTCAGGIVKKILLGIAVVILLAIGGGAWWLYSSLDQLVGSAIRKYGSEITGVSVKLSSVKITPADGTATLRGLVVGNPKDFNTEHSLSLGEISMSLDTGSLTKDVILIKEISIIRPDITYEYATRGSNVDVIQRNVDRFVAERLGANDQTKGKGAGKKLIIENFYIRGGKINASATVVQGKALSVPLPDLHLRDIGKKSNGATAGEAVKQILGAVTQSVTRAVGNLSLGAAADTLKKGAGDTLKGLFK